MGITHEETILSPVFGAHDLLSACNLIQSGGYDDGPLALRNAAGLIKIKALPRSESVPIADSAAVQVLGLGSLVEGPLSPLGKEHWPVRCRREHAVELIVQEPVLAGPLTYKHACAHRHPTSPESKSFRENKKEEI